MDSYQRLPSLEIENGEPIPKNKLRFANAVSPLKSHGKWICLLIVSAVLFVAMSHSYFSPPESFADRRSLKMKASNNDINLQVPPADMENYQFSPKKNARLQQINLSEEVPEDLEIIEEGEVNLVDVDAEDENYRQREDEDESDDEDYKTKNGRTSKLPSNFVPGPQQVPMVRRTVPPVTHSEFHQHSETTIPNGFRASDHYHSETHSASKSSPNAAHKYQRTKKRVEDRNYHHSNTFQTSSEHGASTNARYDAPSHSYHAATGSQLAKHTWQPAPYRKTVHHSAARGPSKFHGSHHVSASQASFYHHSHKQLDVANSNKGSSDYHEKYHYSHEAKHQSSYTPSHAPRKFRHSHNSGRKSYKHSSSRESTYPTYKRSSYYRSNHGSTSTYPRKYHHIHKNSHADSNHHHGSRRYSSHSSDRHYPRKYHHHSRHRSSHSTDDYKHHSSHYHHDRSSSSSGARKYHHHSGRSYHHAKPKRHQSRSSYHGEHHSESRSHYPRSRPSHRTDQVYLKSHRGRSSKTTPYRHYSKTDKPKSVDNDIDVNGYAASVAKSLTPKLNKIDRQSPRQHIGHFEMTTDPVPNKPQSSSFVKRQDYAFYPPSRNPRQQYGHFEMNANRIPTQRRDGYTRQSYSRTSGYQRYPASYVARPSTVPGSHGAIYATRPQRHASFEREHYPISTRRSYQQPQTRVESYPRYSKFTPPSRSYSSYNNHVTPSRSSYSSYSNPATPSRSYSSYDSHVTPSRSSYSNPATPSRYRVVDTPYVPKKQYVPSYRTQSFQHESRIVPNYPPPNILPRQAPSPIAPDYGDEDDYEEGDNVPKPTYKQSRFTSRKEPTSYLSYPQKPSGYGSYGNRPSNGYRAVHHQVSQKYYPPLYQPPFQSQHSVPKNSAPIYEEGDFDETEP